MFIPDCAIWVYKLQGLQSGHIVHKGKKHTILFITLGFFRHFQKGLNPIISLTSRIVFAALSLAFSAPARTTFRKYSLSL